MATVRMSDSRRRRDAETLMNGEQPWLRYRVATSAVNSYTAVYLTTLFVNCLQSTSRKLLYRRRQRHAAGHPITWVRSVSWLLQISCQHFMGCSSTAVLLGALIVHGEASIICWLCILPPRLTVIMPKLSMIRNCPLTSLNRYLPVTGWPKMTYV